jgi:hypothetical protein
MQQNCHAMHDFPTFLSHHETQGCNIKVNLTQTDFDEEEGWMNPAQKCF